MISLTLVLLMLCLWDRLHETSGQYCVDQPARTESTEGKSVTIPCQFAFPKLESNIASATIIVRASDQRYCSGENKVIYNSHTRQLSPKNQERLNVTFDLRHRNASITINNVMKEDATHYCCRIELTFDNGSTQKWQIPDGTRLTVKGRNEPGLETIPVIFAAPGENVTLLGHFTSNILTSASKVTCHVRRTADIGTTCDRGTDIGECAYRNNTLSFQINQVTSKDEAFYCWQVNISTNNEEKNTYYYLGPQLRIIGKTNTLNISQTEEVEFHQSATINCSFTPLQNNIVRTEVYWIFGDARESYVYHPNLDYIHPDYKGKTRLVDGSNLLLQDFNRTDNTTFYCRVIFRQCFGKEGSPNRIDTTLEEGPGTRLTLKVSDHNPITKNKLSPVATIILCVVLVFLVIFMTLAIYFSKKRGSKRNSIRETTVEIIEMTDDLKGGYENPTMIRRQQEGEDLVYSNVNHSTSSMRKNTEKPSEGPPVPSTETVYAKGEDLVYSTVNHSASSLCKNTEKPSKEPSDPATETVYAEVRKS